MSYSKTYVWLWLGCFSILLAGSHCTSSNSGPTIEQQIDTEWVSQTMQMIAGDQMGGRDTPSSGLDSTASYLVTKLSQWGIAPAFTDGYRQQVPLIHTLDYPDQQIQIGNEEYNTPSLALYLGLQAANLEAEAIFVPQLDEITESIEGKIVITMAGTPRLDGMFSLYQLAREKNRKVREMGGLALIEVFRSGKFSWPMVQYVIYNKGVRLKPPDHAIPHFFIRDPGTAKLTHWSKNAPAIKLQVDKVEYQKISTFNVAGKINGSEYPDQTILLTAHYDHIGVGAPNASGDSIYNGARDNGIGTAAVLAAARYLSSHHPKRSVMFAFFTAEEKGLWGSSYFSSNLPADQAVFLLNNDNAGYTDTTKVGVVGYEYLQSPQVFDSALHRVNMEMLTSSEMDLPMDLYYFSDQIHFAGIGIPSVLFTMAVENMNEDITTFYHQAADNPETLNLPYATRFIRAYVITSSLLANQENIPGWKPSAPFYEPL